MKTKALIYALLVLVFCSLTLTCVNDLVPAGFSTLPEGAGYLKLSITGQNTGRTVIPTNPTYKYYLLIFVI